MKTTLIFKRIMLAMMLVIAGTVLMGQNKESDEKEMKARKEILEAQEQEMKEQRRMFEEQEEEARDLHIIYAEKAREDLGWASRRSELSEIIQIAWAWHQKT